MDWVYKAMNIRYSKGVGSFITIRMPDAVRVGLHRQLNAIKSARNSLQVRLASERAEGFSDALKTLSVLSNEDMANVSQVIHAVVQARTQALTL